MWDGYHTMRWRKLRTAIMRRDGYMCQEALRFGKHVEAETVHHCCPAEEYPEFAWAPWNLVSITIEAHRAMHNADGSLTALGEAWKRRRSPPGRG